MLFNSLEFTIFFPLVFILYWKFFNRNLKSQNLLVLVASYIFYGWWDWRFLSLIFFSTVTDYLVGLGLQNSNGRRRLLIVSISLIVNLGLLGFFKYFNFFIDSFSKAFSFFGKEISTQSLNIILPVGISFYTFQTMSYTLDIYRNRLKPTRDFIAFAAFVAFFPQLVAGPIERASNLMPQMLNRRVFSLPKAKEGIRLLLWGFFKKIVIADNLAPSVNEIFSNYSHYSSDVLILGAVLFAFQIYGDFSGYSNIARGLAKLLGFELMVNFNFPYFSRSISEFWRRWHISLSSWFRDYLYIPLGGSRVNTLTGIRNVFIIFLVSGFWHGANWTFLVWGGIHALFFVPSFVTKKNRKYLNDLETGRFWLPKFSEFIRIIWVFILVVFAWIFFRADSLGIAIDYIRNIFQFNLSHEPFLNPYDNQTLIKEYLSIIFLVVVEYLIITRVINFFSQRKLLGIAIDASLLVLIILNIPISNQLEFIYFQF